jgi:rubrerythrin
MDTGINAALTALHQAIELEIEGQRFYQQAAERTDNPQGAEMFRSLADDEVIHERILRRQFDALEEGEGTCPGRQVQGWMPVLSMVEGLPDGVGEATFDLTSSLFPEGEKMLEKAVQPDASDLDALLFALQIENQSFNLYYKLAQTTDDPNGKRMYEFLADAERGHFEWLMLNYEHLSTTGSWASS